MQCAGLHCLVWFVYINYLSYPWRYNIEYYNVTHTVIEIIDWQLLTDNYLYAMLWPGLNKISLSRSPVKFITVCTTVKIVISVEQHKHQKEWVVFSGY